MLPQPHTPPGREEDKQRVCAWVCVWRLISRKIRTGKREEETEQRIEKKRMAVYVQQINQSAGADLQLQNRFVGMQGQHHKCTYASFCMQTQTEITAKLTGFDLEFKCDSLKVRLYCVIFDCPRRKITKHGIMFVAQKQKWHRWITQAENVLFLYADLCYYHTVYIHQSWWCTQVY